MPWMTDLFFSDQVNERGPFAERPLYRITLPGTHDSGCYVDQAFTNALSKTQTQDIYAQLLGGIRYFDIRPLAKDGHFYTYHGPLYVGGQIDGDNGILEQVRDFMVGLEDSDRELVILNISHFKNPATEGQRFTDGDHKLLIGQIQDVLGEHLVTFNQGNLNLFSAPYQRVLSDIEGGMRSRVVVLYDGALDTPREAYIDEHQDLPEGFFVLAPKYIRSANNIFLFDQYANRTSVDGGYFSTGMQPDQLDKLKHRSNYLFAPNKNWSVPSGYPTQWFDDAANGVENTLHLLSWTLTPQSVGGEPLKYAKKYANPSLLPFLSEGVGRWAGDQSYYAVKDPQINIVYVDYYESLRQENNNSPWFQLAMPVAIAARMNVGPVTGADQW